MIDEGEDTRPDNKEEGDKRPLSPSCEPHAPTFLYVSGLNISAFLC